MYCNVHRYISNIKRWGVNRTNNLHQLISSIGVPHKIPDTFRRSECLIVLFALTKPTHHFRLVLASDVMIRCFVALLCRRQLSYSTHCLRQNCQTRNDPFWLYSGSLYTLSFMCIIDAFVSAACLNHLCTSLKYQRMIIKIVSELTRSGNANLLYLYAVPT